MNHPDPQEPKKPFPWRNALSWLIPSLGILVVLGLYFSGPKKKTTAPEQAQTEESQTGHEASSPSDTATQPLHSEKTAGVSPAKSQPVTGAHNSAQTPEKKQNWFLSFFSSKKSETESTAESIPTPNDSSSSQKSESKPGTKSEAEVASSGGATTAEPPNCFTVSYRHKPMAAHSDDESCSRHKNEIHLKHSAYNTASLCVRVDDKPVPFATLKDHPDTVVIGPQAGPHSLITARYCLGKSFCKDGCKVPKDEFMDAIGGLAEDSPKKANLGVWDPKSPSEKNKDIMNQLDPQLKQELAETDAGRSGSVYLFKDWVQENEWAAASCEGLKSPGALQTASTQAARQPGSTQ